MTTCPTVTNHRFSLVFLDHCYPDYFQGSSLDYVFPAMTWPYQDKESLVEEILLEINGYLDPDVWDEKDSLGNCFADIDLGAMVREFVADLIMPSWELTEEQYLENDGFYMSMETIPMYLAIWID